MSCKLLAALVNVTSPAAAASASSVAELLLFTAKENQQNNQSYWHGLVLEVLRFASHQLNVTVSSCAFGIPDAIFSRALIFSRSADVSINEDCETTHAPSALQNQPDTQRDASS
jgi:hypothetical protein